MKMKRICILVLVVLLAACSRDTARVLDEAEVYMQPHPDSALLSTTTISVIMLKLIRCIVFWNPTAAVSFHS